MADGLVAVWEMGPPIDTVGELVRLSAIQMRLPETRGAESAKLSRRSLWGSDYLHPLRPPCWRIELKCKSPGGPLHLRAHVSPGGRPRGDQSTGAFQVVI